MKHLPLLLALGVFLGLGLALWTRHPQVPDDALFGAEVALAPELPPLVLPGGTLALHGRVHSSTGTPAADAFVVLERPEDEAAHAEPLYHAYTDAEGRFTLTRLAPGSYRVVLQHASAPPREFDFELPSAGAGADEVLWELAAPLPPLPALPEIRRGALAVRVLAPAVWAADGAHTLEGFELVLTPAAGTHELSGACERRAATDAEGRAQFAELVVAEYQLELLPPWARGGTWPVLARSTCAAVEGAANEIALAPVVGALEGELLEDGGEPLVGALIEVTSLEAQDPVGKPEMWPPEVSDEAGRFRLELLPPGHYRLHLRAGPVAHDSEVVVEAGECTRVPLEPLALRAGD
ncbi:MAG: carboxypeptidase regulatory-like domain-containing protein [Planctomycetes bacterium]|nr:carboxypeptidase regulatory-like domain-containing protein [Planctomycetota bacterium]